MNFVRVLTFGCMLLAVLFASSVALANDKGHEAPAPVEPNTCQTFTDVSPELMGRVICLSCRGIISGYADGTFRPSNYITRGQLAKIVSNAAGFVGEYSTQRFSDVPVDSTFYQYIERLARSYIVSGYSDGTFRPGQWITRGQAAKILASVITGNGLPYNQIFADIPWGHPFYFSANKLYAAGVMTGYACGGPNEPCDNLSRPYFRPTWGITRGEVVANIVSAFFRYECSSEEPGR